MTDMQSFEHGVKKATELIDTFGNEKSDPESYNMFYKLLGAVNAIYAILSDGGDIPLNEVQRQIVEETGELLNREEQ